MNAAKHVLLVTNSTTEDEVKLIHDSCVKARNELLEIKMSLVHVIPNLPTCYFNIPSMVTLAERYYEEANKALTEIGNLLEVPKKNQWVITGRIKTEVLRLANKLDIHFILASSTSIQDLHTSFSFSFARKEQQTPIRSINSLVAL